jgi:hypothetical protein
MAVPDDVAGQAETLPVGRSPYLASDKPFSFGAYQVSDIERNWYPRQASPVLAPSPNTPLASYAFKFAGPDGEARGECALETAAPRISRNHFILLRRTDRLGCRCQGPNIQSDVTLIPDTDRALTGQANLHGSSVDIMPVTHYANGAPTRGPFAGLQARTATPAGAVELLRPGRVWLARDLDQTRRSDLACLFAALLIYQEPLRKF